MRKRIIIGLLAVVLIGVVAFFLSQPKKGSVEYHIEAYRDAERRSGEDETLADRIREMLNDARGQQGSYEIGGQREHERALIGLKYLEERTFVVSNETPGNVCSAVYRAMLARGTNREFFRASVWGTNGVKVVTVKSNMPTDEEVVRELESGVQKNK